MVIIMKKIILEIMSFLKIDYIISSIIKIPDSLSNFRYQKKYETCRFYGKNNFNNINNLKIGKFTCLKDTYIEASGGVEIGSYVHGAINLVIWSSNHIYDGNMIPFNYDYIYKKVVIEDFVWIGEGVKILPGVKIGEGAIIGMGAVVCKDIPPYAIAAGNPAQIIKYRDIDIFKENKEKKSFRDL